jgi:hypothetical protein
MGTTYTPPFRIEYRDQAGWHRRAWESRVHRPYCGLGRPSDEKAEQWRKEMNASFQPGGTNEHIRIRGTVPHISQVRIVRQLDQAVVARAIAPLFEVVEGRPPSAVADRSAASQRTAPETAASRR